MGCTYSSRVYHSPVSTARPKVKDPCVTEYASLREISQIREAIKRNDKILLQKALGGQKVQENLGAPGEDYTCLHHAAACNAYVLLPELISLAQKNEYRFQDIVNVQDSNRQTPAMIAVQHDHHLIFHELLKYDAVDYILRNNKEKTIMDLLTTAPNCNRVFTEFSRGQKRTTSIKFVRSPSRKEESLSTMNSQKSLRKNSELLRSSRKNSEARTEYLLAKIDSNTKIFQVLRRCIESKSSWKDLDFISDVTSITKDPTHPKYEQYKKAVWRRPHEIFQTSYEKITIFDDINSRDLQPGLHGISYFLACLSATAEFPSRLTEIIVNKDCTKYGAYSVRFYIQGIPTEVVIDDYIPCHHDNVDLPLFSSYKEKELWALLIEKAWAKCFMRYTICEAGDPAWAMEYLHGVPATTMSTKNYSEEELFKILRQGDKNNWIISACVNKGESGQQNEKGLVYGHPYALLGVYQYNKHKIVKLRNPWGQGMWTGEFSENSAVWSEPLKRELGSVEEDKELFFMTIQDFKNNFEAFSIAYYHDNWHYTHQEIESDAHHAVYYEFDVSDTAKVYLRVHQADPMLMKLSNPNYKCSPVEMELCRVEEDDDWLTDVLPDIKDHDVNGILGHHSVSLVKDKKYVELSPGRYVLRIKVKWLNGKKDRFVLSSYSSHKLELRTSTFDRQEYHKKRALGFVAKDHTKQYFQEDCFYKTGTVGKLHYFYVMNNSAGKLEVVGELKDPENVKMRKGEFVTGDLSYKLSLQPEKSELVLAKSLDGNKKAHVDFDWSYNFF